MSKRIRILIVIILSLSVLMTACQPAETTTPEAGEPVNGEEAPVGESGPEEAKETITFADCQWQSLWINNAIAMFIVEHGYGYPVEEVTISTPVMQQSIVTDGVQVSMEMWTTNYEEWWNEQQDANKIVGLGDIMESSAQGFYVPRYVIEGDEERGIEPMAPDLKSVFDLPKYKDLFTDPEDPDKGVIYSCVTGWDCAEVNRVKVFAYDLDETFNVGEPGSSGALDAAIAGPYKKGEPVVSYYWEPTWLLGVYDMVLLEEPEYTDTCWEKITAITNDNVIDESFTGEDVPEDAGCSYQNAAVPKAVSAGMAERNPEVVEFLDKMFIGTGTLNKLSAYMEENGAEVDEAALWYLENYEDDWKSWLPEDVVAKVETALANQ